MRILLTIAATLFLAGCSGSCTGNGSQPQNAESPRQVPDASTVHVIHKGKRIECPVPHASWDEKAKELTVRVSQHRRAGLGEPPAVLMVLKIKDSTAPLETGNLESVQMSFENMPDTGKATMTGSNTLKAIRSIEGELAEGRQMRMEVEFGLDNAKHQTGMRGMLRATIQ